MLTPLIFEVIDNLKPSWRNELEITDALDNLLKQNNNISYETITDYWKDTGTPDDILHANGEIIKNMPDSFEGKKENDVIINGKVIVGKNSIIESNVIIIGPVIIGENCKILTNSRGSKVIIGPNTSIGDNSIISTSNIENSIVMKNCKINSIAGIKDSIIANNSEIKDNSLSNNKIFLLGEGSKVSL